MDKNSVNRNYEKEKGDILSDVQVSKIPTLKGISSLLLSGFISTFGVYGVIVGAVKDDYLMIALGVFILLLVVVDTIKKGSLIEYLNAKTRYKITSRGVVKKNYLYIFFFTVVFALAFDFLGSLSTASYVDNAYKKWLSTSSEEYSILKQNAKSVSDEMEIYKIEVETWKLAKKDAYQTCSQKWHGWKPKYKADCRKKWDSSNPMPVKPSGNSTISMEKFEDIQREKNKEFIAKNLYWVVLVLSFSLTAILQYLTIADILARNEKIEEGLTPQLIGTLNDRLLIIEANQLDHEARRNRLIEETDREHKIEARRFERLGEDIKLVTARRATESREETVKRIANNQLPADNFAKSAFIDVTDTVEVFEAVKPKRKEVIENEFDDKTKNITLKMYLIRLFNNGTIGKGEKLISKKDIVDTRNRHLNKLTAEYNKKLEEIGVLNNVKGKGCFAEVDLKDALNKIKGVEL